jgi:hypothetical protein
MGGVNVTTEEILTGDLQAWFEKHGGRLNFVTPQVNNRTRARPPTLVSTESIEEREAVVKMPFRLIMCRQTARNVLIGKSGRYLGEELSKTFERNEVWGLAIFLLHEYYKEVARRSWEHAYLFRTFGVTTEQQARNRKEIDEILDTAFDTVLYSFLPWQSIVNTYFSVEEGSHVPQKAEDVIQATVAETPAAAESVPALVPALVPAAEPEKKVAFEVEEDDDDVGTDDDDHPKLQLSDETAVIDFESLDEEKEEKDVKVEAKDGELVLKL